MNEPFVNPHEYRVLAMEFNTFGVAGRTCVLYRGYDGMIVAWRWYSENLEPRMVNGRWVATFKCPETAEAITVRAEVVYQTRTQKDVELEERAIEWTKNHKRHNFRRKE